MIDFGKRLKEIADRLGKEQQKLAHDLGISKGVASHYILGRRRVPSEILQKIVEVYGINPQFLFDETAPLFIEETQTITPSFQNTQDGDLIIIEEKGEKVVKKIYNDVTGQRFILKSTNGNSIFEQSINYVDVHKLQVEVKSVMIIKGE